MDSDDESDESTRVTIADPTEDMKPEDYILAFPVTEHLRKVFVLSLIACNFLSVNFALVFFMLSWYVQNSLEKQITFLQDFYQPQAIPVIMAISGCVMFFSSLIGIKSAIGGGSVEDAESAKSAAWYFMVYCGAAAATVFVVCFAGFTCFMEIRTLEAALGMGLQAGMEKYRTEIAVKEEIDALQEDYKCCGIDSYKDWYDVSWTEVKYLDTLESVVKK
ncbi:peripherin-2-like [Uloborus diversus]|uniref:peripherin-2-like n=1 Tax=Uloborus diversus TaxID=327109 RepID=UPI00240982D4|nr:peripherin-2-like [Uloborus diversus]